MKIQYASDLHLELSGNSKYVKDIPFEVTGDILVLAGDTAYLRDKNLPDSKFWKWASENYRKVFLVPGNHEYYGFGDVLENGDSWSREILPNVHYHQNKVVRVDDTDFILSTLWSQINPANEFAIWQGMSDFYQIRYGGKPFMPGHFNDEHRKCLEFIKKSVAESNAKHIVVVTHHLPTMALVASHHKRSPLNSAFANNLDDFIAESRIDVIISVGYRVNSIRATAFRQWATSVLKQYMIKGYAVNQNAVSEQKYEELKRALGLLENVFGQNYHIWDGQELYPSVTVSLSPCP